jgi:hypothetical protein
MAKNYFFMIVLLCVFAVGLASGDIMPDNSHPLERCVKFVNLDEVPDVVLIGYVIGPMIRNYEAYQIEDDVCLDKGYKFNSLNIYWTKKENFSSLDLKNLSGKLKNGSRDDLMIGHDVYLPTNLTLLFEELESFGGYVDDSNPLIKETIEYSITEFPNGSLIAYRSKQTYKYNNGQPDKVETFRGPNAKPTTTTTTTSTTTSTTTITSTTSTTTALEPIHEPTPEPPGFWAGIICFFQKLFGGSC